ncbi:MAG: hypothetical protein LM563_06500 [Thermofilum sp.]|nr:hypothetical protein [Thermofilum sp.]
MPRRKALITANFSRSALERLRAHVDVVYKPWGETRRVLSEAELVEELHSSGADILVVELEHVSREVLEGAELPDLARGLFEFVAMSIRANVELAARVCGRRPGAVKMVGGLTRLRLLKEMLPHVLRSPLVAAARYYSGSLGCAVMAASALGYYRDWWEAAAAMSPLERLSPDEALAAEYQAVYTSWEDFYMRFEVV